MKSSSDKYESKKEQIIVAAEELFAYYGYAKTTLDDIAQKVGIKKNSLYYYFESKELLLNSIIARIFDSKSEQFNKQSAKSKSTFEKMKIFLKVFVTQRLDEEKQINITPAAYLEIIKVVEQSFSQFFLEAEKIFASILEEGMQRKELRKHDPGKAAKIILDFTRAMEYQMYSDSETQFIDENIYKNLENKVIQFLELTYQGLRS